MAEVIGEGLDGELEGAVACDEDVAIPLHSALALLLLFRGDEGSDGTSGGETDGAEDRLHECVDWGGIGGFQDSDLACTGLDDEGVVRLQEVGEARPHVFVCQWAFWRVS